MIEQNTNAATQVSASVNKQSLSANTAETCPIVAIERKKNARQRPVYIYLAVLFTVAFLLILWSFLMSHRSNEMVLNELQDRSTLLQSIMNENNSLELEIQALQKKIEEKENELANSEGRYTESSNAMIAMDWLRQIEVSHAAKRKNETREIIMAFQQSGFVPYLSTNSLHSYNGVNYDSPMSCYQAILYSLFPELG